MTIYTKQIIIKNSKRLFSQHGYEGFSMRTLSAKSGVSLSSIYHFFKDKDVLLKVIFDETRSSLGKKRSRLSNRDSAGDMLKDRIMFQFKNIEDVVFILKYYLHFRKKFPQNSRGFIPPKAYLHIDEVLERGITTGEFKLDPENLHKESKVITHAINGYLLEYYPKKPRGEELEEIVSEIHAFILRSLTNEKGVDMSNKV